MTFVRAIKGAPASILWAFLFTRRVMTALELQQWTGYKGDNVTVAVRLLVDLGWLSARTPRGPWCLVEGRQLPLMELIGKVDQITRRDSDLIGFVDESVVVVDLFSNPPTITTTTTTIGDESDLIGFVRSPEKWAALNIALDEYQIVGKRRKDLIACEWVDDAYVRACVEHAKNEPANWDNPVGMAITRMLEHVSPPAVRENGHPENCKCTKCTVDSFLGRRVRKSSFICDTCHQQPCSCEEHADTCMCSSCRGEHPERFCTCIKSDGKDASWACDAYVEPNHQFCSEHEESGDA